MCVLCAKIAMFSVIPASLRSAWHEEGAGHFIAQFELAAITTGVALRRALLHHCDVVWLVDNSAALASVVRGKSNCESMYFAAVNTQLTPMRDEVRVWFEHVESKANWTDGTSREAAWD